MTNMICAVQKKYRSPLCTCEVFTPDFKVWVPYFATIHYCVSASVSATQNPDTRSNFLGSSCWALLLILYRTSSKWGGGDGRCPLGWLEAISKPAANLVKRPLTLSSSHTLAQLSWVCLFELSIQIQPFTLSIPYLCTISHIHHMAVIGIMY